MAFPSTEEELDAASDYLGRGKELLHLAAKVIGRLREDSLEGGVELTPGQKQALRAFADAWKQNLLVWYQGLPF